MPNNIINFNEEAIHTELKDLVRTSVEDTLNALLDSEADKLVNAERYARDTRLSSIRKNRSAGAYVVIATIFLSLRPIVSDTI